MTGCASFQRPGPAEGGFLLRGKLGVVQTDDSFSARFLWRQRDDAFTIDLWGPLGQGRMQLTGDRRELALREGDGTLVSRGPPEAVMTRQLGWSLPLSVLPEWVRGRPARGVTVRDERRDQAGRLAGFRQLGWLVELERYAAVTPEADGNPRPAGSREGTDVEFLPHRVTASRGAYRVRLAISQWRLGASADGDGGPASP